MGLKNKMAARIVFVDDVFCGEDSDEGQNPINPVIEEEKDDESEEQSGSEDENEENNWVFGACEPTRLDFTADEGLNANLPDSPSFSEYFHLLFPDYPFEDMARHANKYVRETVVSLRERELLSPNSRFSTWPEDGVTPNDIKAFLAMIVAMGLVNQEYIQDYWSTDEVLSTPFLSRIL